MSREPKRKLEHTMLERMGLKPAKRERNLLSHDGYELPSSVETFATVIRRMPDAMLTGKVLTGMAKEVDIKDAKVGAAIRKKREEINDKRMRDKKESDKEILAYADLLADLHRKRPRVILINNVVSHFKNDAKMKWSERKVRNALIGWLPSPPR